MKKILVWLVIVTGLGYLLFTLIAPPIVDKNKNRTSIPKPYKCTAAATQLIESMSFIGDLHCDALLWDRDLTKKADYGHVDFPRMEENNVAFQAFTIVTKSPKGQNFVKNSGEGFDMITALSIGQGQKPSTWFSLMNRAAYQCQKLHEYAKKYKGKFIVIKNKTDFQELLADRQAGKKTLGGLLGVEGGHCLEGKLSNLDRLYKEGVRMLGPAHFFDNEMGGSAHGIHQGGLTDFGLAVVKEMNAKGMIIDVAHSSPAVIDDILRLYSGPILSSHTGVDGTFPSSRNLSDKQLKGIAQKGGIIGIAYFPEAVGSGDIKAIVDAMTYTKNLIGIEHVALGSDFDGSVTVPFDVTGLGLLVDEMFAHGYQKEEIKAILGDNLKRFLLQYLPNS